MGHLMGLTAIGQHPGYADDDRSEKDDQPKDNDQETPACQRCRPTVNHLEIVGSTP
jgi:hypothetical protein